MLVCAPFSCMGSENLSQALLSSSELRTGEDILRNNQPNNQKSQQTQNQKHQNKTTGFLTEKHYFNKQKLHTVITWR